MTLVGESPRPSEQQAGDALRAGDAGRPCLRLLIVGDDPHHRNQIRDHLVRGAQWQYVVREADTAGQALELCAAKDDAPDCVIVDLPLRDMDVRGVIEALKLGAVELPLPIIVLTGSDEVHAGRAALALGAQDYLAKRWVTPESLTRAVTNAIERFRLMHRVRENERRLRLAMAASETGMWDWDIRTDAVVWSPECYGICGVGEAHFEGTASDFSKLVHPEDYKRVWNTVRAAIDQHTRYEGEFRIVRPNGEVRWVANLARGIYDPQGQPLRMIGTLTDITDRKQG